MPASLNEAFTGPTSSSYRQQHNVPQAVKYTQIEPSPAWATAASIPGPEPRRAQDMEMPYRENGQRLMGGSPVRNSPIYEPVTNAPPPQGSYVSAYGNIPSQHLYPPMQEPFGCRPHMWGPPSIAYPGSVQAQQHECSQTVARMLACPHCRRQLRELMLEERDSSRRSSRNSISDSLSFSDFSVSIQTLILALALIVLVHRILRN
jgi:hypothetical protein